MYPKLKCQYDATTLEFEYVVKWGHYTQDLEYCWAIEEIDGVSIYTKVQSLYPLLTWVCTYENKSLKLIPSILTGFLIRSNREGFIVSAII